MTTHARAVEPLTAYVSDALQARLDTYCAQCEGRTRTSVVFEALEHLRDDLPELMRTARARLASPQRQVHYLGSGPVQVRVRPQQLEATVLDQVSSELGVPVTTWLPPLLNAYLPGRREPENMPWLVPVDGRI